jgi:hypothetical protein
VTPCARFSGRTRALRRTPPGHAPLRNNGTGPSCPCGWR